MLVLYRDSPLSFPTEKAAHDCNKSLCWQPRSGTRVRLSASAMGGSDEVALTSYPALLWLATLSALLGSFQNGGRFRLRMVAG